MRTAYLNRFIKRDDSTIGNFVFSDGTKMFAMELPWRDNAHDISCIPCGVYICHMLITQHYGKVYQITNVPDRTDILIHSAARPRDILGCVGVGMSYSLTTTDTLLLNSPIARAAILAATKEEDFQLTISGVVG